MRGGLESEIELAGDLDRAIAGALVIWPKLVLPKLVLGVPHCGLLVTP